MHALLEEELARVRNSFGAAEAPPEAAALKDAWVTAMKNCFRRMDMIVGSSCGCGSHKKAGLIGSTAVVVVLTDEHIVVANCGDSRAVLSRRGRAVPLSVDHKVTTNHLVRFPCRYTVTLALTKQTRVQIIAIYSEIPPKHF